MATAKKAPAKKKKGGIVVRGKRKEAIARAAIRKGKGVVRVNHQRLETMANRYARELIAEPLRVAPEVAAEVDIDVYIVGGGAMGQAQAARLSIARALCEYSGAPEVREKMMARDRFLLAEDSRRVEPKKYLGPKARARFQKSYR
ncbi:MAG: 30S ribosomal protein S9 [Candidatus Micrarchaeota archaeon]|nr:30S ribosomal protein S9 [Candidatus Micrarchaeota archaeon]